MVWEVCMRADNGGVGSTDSQASQAKPTPDGCLVDFICGLVIY